MANFNCGFPLPLRGMSLGLAAGGTQGDCRFGERKFEGEAVGAAVEGVDFTAMGFDGALHDGEAETGAAAAT